MLLLICVVPLTILLAYLLIMTNKISSEYDGIVRRITKANAYNINFKEDMGLRDVYYRSQFGACRGAGGHGSSRTG